MPERGEVWLANLNPRRGTEPGKTRPMLIVQAQALIDDAEPLRIRVHAQSSLRRDSELPIDQLRAIDNRRLIEGLLAHLDAPTMARVAAALREVRYLG